MADVELASYTLGNVQSILLTFSLGGLVRLGLKPRSLPSISQRLILQNALPPGPSRGVELKTA